MKLTMPKNYSVISKNELIYVDGGITFDYTIENSSLDHIIAAACGGAIAGYHNGGTRSAEICAGIATLTQTAWEISQGNFSLKISW